MRVLIGNNDPHLSLALTEMIRMDHPGTTVESVEEVEHLRDADLYLVVLNNVGPYDCEPRERVERVCRHLASLKAPVLAGAGWPDDAADLARQAGVVWYSPLPFDVAGLRSQIARYLR